MMLQCADFTYNRSINKAPSGMDVCPAGRVHKQVNNHVRKKENHTSNFKDYI